MDENEEPVYSYYTIVSDPLTDNDGQDKSVLYLTFGQNDTEDDLMLTADPVQNDEDTAVDNQPGVSNIKLLTLGDTQFFMTDVDAEDENLPEIQPDLINCGDDAPSEDMATAIAEANQETLSNDQDSQYQQIKLEDGTCAIIDKELWNSIIQNAKVEPNYRKDKKFPCMYIGCDKVYSTAQHLTVHVRNHTGSRPYHCTEQGCDKAFATGYSLKAHLRTHTGEKPYGCQLCIKQFKTSGDLQKHIRIHTGEKPFKCPIEGCGRSFTTSNIRKVHVRSHTGERPYVCEEQNCGKAFASATNYKNHMRIHSGEKPYVCPVIGCDKRFTEYSSLYKHNMVHITCKPYRCNYCGQMCKQESTLKAHKRTIHNILITEDGTEIIVKRDSYSDVILEIADETKTELLGESDISRI